MKWVNAVGELASTPHPNTLLWMTKPYVLTHALRRVCKLLTVNVVSQQFSTVMPEESSKLGLDETALPFIREVILEGDGVPLTYGRVIIAPQTYHNHFAAFKDLGAQPIGETLLYNNPESTRSCFEYAKTEDGLWARRSLFTLRQDPLLVTEFFLPSLPDYPDQ